MNPYKRTYRPFIFIATIWLFAACNNNNSPDAVESAQEINEAKIDSAQASIPQAEDTLTPLLKEDAEFVVHIASGQMFEVQLGQLAQTKSDNQRVKDFGAMMANDHATINEEIKMLANRRNIVLAESLSDKQQKEKDKLNKKRGTDFDLAFMDFMVKDHKDNIKEFEKIMRNASDAQLRTFAGNKLPLLQQHLDSAQSIHSAIQKISRTSNNNYTPTNP